MEIKGKEAQKRGRDEGDEKEERRRREGGEKAGSLDLVQKAEVL